MREIQARSQLTLATASVWPARERAAKGFSCAAICDAEETRLEESVLMGARGGPLACQRIMAHE